MNQSENIGIKVEGPVTRLNFEVVNPWQKLQEISIAAYKKWLKAKGGIRPRNYKSLHCSLSPEQLAEFENNWDYIIEKF